VVERVPSGTAVDLEGSSPSLGTNTEMAKLADALFSYSTYLFESEYGYKDWVRLPYQTIVEERE